MKLEEVTGPDVFSMVLDERCPVSRLLAASGRTALQDEVISCDTVSNGTFAKSSFYNRRFFDIADNLAS